MITQALLAEFAQLTEERDRIEAARNKLSDALKIETAWDSSTKYFKIPEIEPGPLVLAVTTRSEQKPSWAEVERVLGKEAAAKLRKDCKYTHAFVPRAIPNPNEEASDG